MERDGSRYIPRRVPPRDLTRPYLQAISGGQYGASNATGSQYAIRRGKPLGDYKAVSREAAPLTAAPHPTPKRRLANEH